MSDSVIDTHAAVWYFAKSPQLSATARTAVNTAIAKGFVMILPTVSIVEIVYLIEKKRLAQQTLTSLMQYLKLPNSSFVTQDLTEDIAQTLTQIPRSTVPDMPDRIIAATALHLNLPLITKDSKIRALQNIQTIWRQLFISILETLCWRSGAKLCDNFPNKFTSVIESEI